MGGADFFDLAAPLPPVGMKDIKWVTLYDKWRSFVPVELRSTFKYYAEDAGLERRTKVKTNTNEAKSNRKGGTVTKTT